MYVRHATGLAGALFLLLATPPTSHAGDKDRQNMPTASKPAFTNHLIHATSPYLLQHAHNPVNWYEWGPEALDRARAEHKPIFLSIGYSACHWCHVMAHESFENEEIAAVMNKFFICIKVDREERPDLDEVYMQATMILNQGRGGWPMSVWLTPELKPFFAGTYFPPTSKWGRPGFKELCERIGDLWQTRRADIESDAERLTAMVQKSLKAAKGDKKTLTLDDIDRTVKLLADAFDAQRGGITGGGTNKFPPSMTLDLFLRTAARHGTDENTRQRLMKLVEITLDHMARGGIYDQLAGGFHRYSTDVEWLVPHFEKMLYDQALLSRIYIDAYQATGKPLYARIARETLDYVLADLRSPQGGFYSTRDADSEGVEGKVYVWTRREILDVLGDEDGALVCDYYDVTDAGNWNDPHDPDAGKNILHVSRSLEQVAQDHHITPAELERRLTRARAKLLEVRNRRVPPARDEKILAEWNGLMIASLARGGAVFGEPRYVEAAAHAAQFVLENQYAGGRLQRSFRDGRTLETAFLTDYACLIEGLLDLYEATQNPRWLDRANELNGVVISQFYDSKEGGFFFTPAAGEHLIARSKDVRDSATPSGNSVELMNLLRLADMRADESLAKIAEKTIDHFADEVARSPGTSERFLAAVEFARLGPVEVVIVGSPTDPETQALLRIVNHAYLPNRVLMLLDPAHPGALPASPLLAGRSAVGGKPTAYVCHDYACELPVTTPAALREQLTGATARQ